MANWWGLVEKVTGISREDVKLYVRGRAIEFAKSITCVCGDPEWQHERGNGKCLRCQCQKFEPQHVPPPSEEQTPPT